MKTMEEKIGERVKEIRLARGFSIALLSRETGIDRSYLSRLENYGGNISISQLTRLCVVLEINPRDFFAADIFSELGPVIATTNSRKQRTNPSLCAG